MAHAAYAKTTKAVEGPSLDRLHATLALDGPVSQVPLVSAARAGELDARMGVRTVRGLLSLYPHRYLDMSQVVSVQQATIGSHCTIAGTVHEVKAKNPRPKLTLVEISVVDQTGIIIVTCFNQPWLARQLEAGQGITVSGAVEFNYGFKRMTNPLLALREPGEAALGVVLPFHPATAKISRANMRRIMGNALELARGAYDPLPLVFRRRYRLYSRYQALRGVHAPQSLADAEQARRRLRYEELFFLELELTSRARERTAGAAAFEHVLSGPRLAALRHNIPFSLTADQGRAVDEILARMSLPAPMDHLLLGDVGTGKTLVAAHALAAAADSGAQALMMGPTEVLVRQYGQALGPLLDAAGVRWAVLTGSAVPDERARIVEGFAAGEIDVLFGTHALLEPDVVAARCSLVVIDEQQRFGVDQRECLVAKAPGADVLSLTATPIPRSLALTRYGGMTLGYLREAPAKQAGRSTKACHFQEEGIAYDALRAALAAGEQAYVVCPLIGLDLAEDISEDDESRARQEGTVSYAAIEWGLEHDQVGDTLSAATLHAKILQEQIVPNARVGLLHGRLSAAEKQRIMDEFREGALDVLVSTTVIEVGVDVPNATVMIVEDADRFGLAQLHQLRGRVGRGAKPGRVFLVSRSRAPEALARLHLMETTEDGFSLAEQDLKMRREGDVLGARQHGVSPLRLVNVVRDQAVIEAALADARACLEPGFLSDDERRALTIELAALREGR